MKTAVFFCTLLLSLYSSLLHAQQKSVQLIGFGGENIDGAVVLSWTTSYEENVDHFDIQRSTDGEHFIRLTTVSAAGNSSTPLQYTVTDSRPFGGMNYYRVTLVDLDSQKIYSPIVLVHCAKQAKPLLFPNPVTQYFTLVAGVDGIKEVSIFDLSGRKMQGLINAEGQTSLTVSCGQLPKGTYFLEIRTAKERIIQQLVKK